MKDLSYLDYMVNGKIFIAVQGSEDNDCTDCALWNDCLGGLCQLPHFAYYEEKQSVPGVADMILPTDAQERKQIPIVTGVLDYFPLAIAEVAKCSLASNEQHNPGEPLYWNRTKSTDHIDCLGRHLIDRGKFDTDGQRHSAKIAWRALANLELELEEAKKKGNL